MLIPITGRSAAEFWLGPGAAIYTNYSFNIRKGLMSFPEDFDYHVTADICRMIAERMELNLPIETFSFDRANHWCGKVTHVLTRYRPLPDKSFVTFKLAGHEIAVARPELCFLQAAKQLEMAELVHLGMRLCGLYYLQPEIKAELKKKNGRTMVQRGRTPVTTAAMIAKYLAKAGGEYGVKRARKAVKFVVDEANSPMEAALATLMSLPVEFGGYGMPPFTMNEPIELSDRAKEHFGYTELRGDFFWREEKFITEYNSHAFHMDARQQAIDADRMNAMQQSGYRVVPITYKNLRDFNSVEGQMSYLMEELGRADLKIRLQENRQMRERLCKELLGTEPDFFDRFQK